jgi:ribonuclease E
MKQEMLINVSQPEECRIAIMEDGVLEELYVERTSQDNLVGNIYKGRIVNIEPSIQAAFVDFGVGRNGFLHISDVEPQYYRQGGLDPDKAFEAGETAARGGEEAETEGDERRAATRRRPRLGDRPRVKPPIQDILRRGDEVLVQVIKEGFGTKGPTLSTYISIPGRYLVLMPPLGRVEEDRRRARAPRAPRHHARPAAAQGRGVRGAHRGHRANEVRDGPRHGLPAAALEVDRPADAEVFRADRHLPGIRHDHPHHP